MEINRNQYLAIGILVLLIGIQFRYIESFTLNKETSTLIRENLPAESAELATTNSSYRARGRSVLKSLPILFATILTRSWRSYRASTLRIWVHP